MKVIETLEYGYSLLDNGNVLSSKNEVLTPEEYSQRVERLVKNKLDWTEVEEDEVEALLSQEDTFAVKLAERNEPNNSFLQFGLLDNEGTAYLLNFSETFGGAGRWSLAETNLPYLAYQVNSKREEVAEEFRQFVEEVFDTKDQVGTLFEKAEDEVFETKKFVKDGQVFALVFKNGLVSNLKNLGEVKGTSAVSSKEGKDNSVARKLATGGFANVK